MLDKKQGKEFCVPQSQGLSPSRLPLKPPLHSHCGPPLTSTSGSKPKKKNSSLNVSNKLIPVCQSLTFMKNKV